MDNTAVIIGVCGLFLTVINLLIGIIIAYVFKAISRLEDRHVQSVGELHRKIETHTDGSARKREKDLKEMRDKFGSIDVKLAVLVPGH